jgi:hypothetical protein
MNANMVSAVFDNHSEAERAISELRSAGVRDNAISMIAKDHGKANETDGAGEKVASVASKTAAGAGIGAVWAWPPSPSPASARWSPPAPSLKPPSAARP